MLQKKMQLGTPISIFNHVKLLPQCHMKILKQMYLYIRRMSIIAISFQCFSPFRMVSSSIPRQGIEICMMSSVLSHPNPSGKESFHQLNFYFGSPMIHILALRESPNPIKNLHPMTANNSRIHKFLETISTLRFVSEYY